MKRLQAQPETLEISEERPFDNDLLEREKPIETLTSVISNVDSPCILSIDAPWGAGKTTFIGMWEKYLRIKGFAVIEFNAWETDFSNDPFLALSSELTSQLEDVEKSDPFTSEIKALSKQASRIAIRKTPSIVGALISGTIASIGPVQELGGAAAAAAVSNFVEGTAERFFLSHGESQHSIAKFREKLKGLAQLIADRRDGRPLVIMIDELDRCRPTYALELLENAKHIFSVKNVTFVLATNRQELAHSVRV